MFGVRVVLLFERTQNIGEGVASWMLSPYAVPSSSSLPISLRKSLTAVLFSKKQYLEANHFQRLIYERHCRKKVNVIKIYSNDHVKLITA